MQCLTLELRYRIRANVAIWPRKMPAWAKRAQRALDREMDDDDKQNWQPDSGSEPEWMMKDSGAEAAQECVQPEGLSYPTGEEIRSLRKAENAKYRATENVGLRNIENAIENDSRLQYVAKVIVCGLLLAAITWLCFKPGSSKVAVRPGKEPRGRTKKKKTGQA